MCIIIYAKPESKPLTPEVLDRCATANRDGMGLMYAEDGVLHTHREMTDLADFITRVQAVQERKLPLAVHFRLATHGSTSLENCHPFYVTPDIGLMHNGILSDYAGDRTRSDTRRIAEETLAGLPEGWHVNPAVITLLADHIGRSNKLVLMDALGDVTIVNEKAGIWEDNIWYSNSGFRPVKQYVETSSAGRTRYHHDWRPQRWDEEEKAWRTLWDREDADEATPVGKAIVPASSGGVKPPAKRTKPVEAWKVTKTGHFICPPCGASLGIEELAPTDYAYSVPVTERTFLPPGAECSICTKVIRPKLTAKMLKTTRRYFDKRYKDVPPESKRIITRAGKPSVLAWNECFTKFGYDVANALWPNLPWDGGSLGVFPPMRGE